MSAVGGAISEGRRKLEVLDGLRGIAILLVFFFHLQLAGKIHPLTGTFHIFQTLLNRGDYGVDLFFFLSGFCLFYPYVRARFEERAYPTLKTFISRRIVKILPSYYLAILGAIFLSYPGELFHSAQDAWRQILLHASFLHALFDDSFGTINPSFWSLGIEIQFYVIFPAIAWCMLRRTWLTVASMLILSAFARFYGLAHPWMNSWMVSHSLPVKLDVFVSGMLAAHLFEALNVRHASFVQEHYRRAWTGLALAGVSLYYLACDSVFPFTGLEYERCMLTLDAAFISTTLGSLFGIKIWKSIIGGPILRGYALISYNLYLWHVPLLSMLSRYNIRSSSGQAQTDFVFGLLIFFCASLVAMLLTFCLERPLVRLLARREAKSISYA